MIFPFVLNQKYLVPLASILNLKKQTVVEKSYSHAILKCAPNSSPIKIFLTSLQYPDSLCQEQKFKTKTLQNKNKQVQYDLWRKK